MAKCFRCGKTIRNNRSACSYCDGYMSGIEKGRADRDKELANVLFGVCILARPIEDIVLETISNERAKVIDEFDKYVNTMSTYSYGVSMLSAEEYIKKSDLIDMLEEFKEQE